MPRFPCLLAVLAVLSAAGAHGEEASCDEGSTCPSAAASPAGDGDDPSLLQRAPAGHVLDGLESVDGLAAGARRGPPTQGDRSIAVALEGGGFLSLADFTGLSMGLLRGLSGLGEKGGLTTLLNKFGSMAGVSGGMWYASMLTYSESYQSLLEGGARLPGLAGLRFNTQFIGPVLNPLKNTSLEGTVNGLKECVQKVLTPILDRNLKVALTGVETTQGKAAQEAATGALPLPWTLEMIAEAVILLQSGQISWSDLVVTMFQRGAGIDPTLPLGTTEHNAWAKGKVLFNVMSAVTPTGSDYFDNGPVIPEVVLYNSLFGKTRFTYAAENRSSNSVGAQVLPVKFSVVVGDGEDQQSVLPFCSSSASICERYAPSYDFNGGSIAENVNFNEIWQGAFEQSAGQLPVSASAASSSAFAGEDALSPDLISPALGALEGAQGCAELATWTTGASGGTGYAQASELRNKMFTVTVDEALATEVASAALQPLIDGGPSDPFGIGTVVGAGATEVLSIQDINLQSNPHDEFFAASFVGGPYPGHYIFGSPSYEDVLKNYTTDFDRIYAKSGSRFFKSLAYGTLHCTTTDNPTLGIEGGRDVTLNVLAVETVNITIGLAQSGYSFDSFFNYGTLVGEIAETMAMRENTQAVRDILQRFFL